MTPLDQPLNARGERILVAMADPAASLRDSAARFRAIGHDFSADLSERMAADADAVPALYHDYARQQAERVGRMERQL